MARKNLSSRMPWFRAEFDLEGLGFGGLALALAILLGGLSWILALFFLIIMGIILLASRDCERTSPAGDTIVLSPCDGVIESVSTVAPPRELRWDAPEAVRIRISSSPFSVNGMRSVITGNVESYLVEPGAPAALSYDPDNSDLKEAFILMSGDAGTVGLRIATGGLGPRLDIDLETGDAVRAGRKIGVRRLGGWSDVYLPVNAAMSLAVGMSVVGGETILSDLSEVTPSDTNHSTEEVITPPTPEVSAVEVKAAEEAPEATQTSDASEASVLVPEIPEPTTAAAAKAEKTTPKAAPKPRSRKAGPKPDTSEN